MIKISLYIILVLMLNSCYSEFFKINQLDSDYSEILACNMSSYKEVERILINGKEAVHINPGATVSLKNYEQTHFEFHSFIKIPQGSDFEINFRSTRDKYDFDKGITLKFERSDVFSFENGSPIQSFQGLEIDPSKFHKLKIISDGKRVKVFVDCDEIFDYRTTLPATEYVIFDSNDAEILLSSIQFMDVFPVNLNDFDGNSLD